jgi:hypothetical protein
MPLVPPASDGVQKVRGEAPRLPFLRPCDLGRAHAVECQEELREIVVLELVHEVAQTVAEPVPVCVADEQRQRPLTGDAPLVGEREHRSVKRARLEEAPPGGGVLAQLVDDQVAPARVDPPDPERGDAQEVVREAVDEFPRWPAQASGVVATDRGRELPLVDEARRRVKQGDEQLAVLRFQRPKRRPHRVGRRRQLPLEVIPNTLWSILERDLRQRLEPVGDKAADPLGREVRMLHDRQRGGPQQPASRAARAAGLRVAEQDERLLREVEVAGIDENLSRGGEMLRAALKLHPAQAGLQRRRARGPDQPVILVEHRQQATERLRPALRRIGPVFRRAERVVGHEHLPALAIEHPPQLLRAAGLVRLPAGGHLRQGEHLSDRRLAHLRRPGQHDEPMPRQYVAGAASTPVSARTPSPAPARARRPATTGHGPFPSPGTTGPATPEPTASPSVLPRSGQGSRTAPDPPTRRPSPAPRSVLVAAPRGPHPRRGS